MCEYLPIKDTLFMCKDGLGVVQIKEAVHSLKDSEYSLETVVFYKLKPVTNEFLSYFSIHHFESNQSYKDLPDDHSIKEAVRFFLENGYVEFKGVCYELPNY